MKKLFFKLFGRKPALVYTAQAIRSCVELSKSGQRTREPKVHISVCSRNGMAGVMTKPDTVQGNAFVEMYGDTYSSILGVPLVDRRDPKQPLGDKK